MKKYSLREATQLLNKAALKIRELSEANGLNIFCPDVMNETLLDDTRKGHAFIRAYMKVDPVRCPKTCMEYITDLKVIEAYDITLQKEYHQVYASRPFPRHEYAINTLRQRCSNFDSETDALFEEALALCENFDTLASSINAPDEEYFELCERELMRANIIMEEGSKVEKAARLELEKKAKEEKEKREKEIKTCSERLKRSDNEDIKSIVKKLEEMESEGDHSEADEILCRLIEKFVPFGLAIVKAYDDVPKYYE